MRLPSLFASTVLLCAAVLAPSVFAPAQAADRATWIWDSPSYAMVEDEAYARDAIAFLKARRIDTVYLYADAFLDRNLLVSQPQQYRALIARMRQNGLRVDALLGASNLTLNELVRPADRQAMLASLRTVLAYQASAAPHERFDGIHLYTEPRLLADLSTRREDVLAQFLDLSHDLVEAKRASGVDVALSAAIPFWFDEVTLDWQGKPRPVSEHLIDLYDSTVVTAYREQAEGPDGIIERARDELNYAALHGKRVVVGVEVAPNRMADATFDDNTEADLEGALLATELANSSHPAFGGFALHHLDAYLMWLVRQWMDAPTGEGTAAPTASSNDSAPATPPPGNGPSPMFATPGLQ